MGTSALILAWLAAAPTTSPAPAELVVFARDPICYMGQSSSDGSHVRIEYHPIDDSYHILLSGRAIDAIAATPEPTVVVRSGYDRHTFKASIIPGNPDVPAAIYAPLSYPERVARSPMNVWPRNRVIEDRLFDPRGVQLFVNDKLVALLDGASLATGSRRLIACASKLSPAKQLPVALRIHRYPGK